MRCGQDRAGVTSVAEFDGQADDAASDGDRGCAVSPAGGDSVARDLPSHVGPWQTGRRRHARFSKDGTWDRMRTAFLIEADVAGEIDWDVSMDSTVARVHQHGATTARFELRPTIHTRGSIELGKFAI